MAGKARKQAISSKPYEKNSKNRESAKTPRDGYLLQMCVVHLIIQNAVSNDTCRAGLLYVPGAALKIRYGLRPVFVSRDRLGESFLRRR
jgi:hypothetical protein